MSRLNAITASLIWLSIAVAVWGHWTHVAIVLVGQIVTVAFNVWVNLRGLEVLGTRIELVRGLCNTISTVSVAHLTGWPMPVWLWPPYTALAFDRSGGNYTFVVVAQALLIQNAVALIDGVSWIHTLVSVLFSAYAWRISEARVRAIRDALDRSHQQRLEIERAHAMTNEALAQVKAESAARARMELELRAAQKLEALGRIASGVAHEINTPIQFVGDSVRFVQEGVTDLLSLCQLTLAARAANDDDSRARVAAAEQATDVPYLVENLPQALARAREGVDRVALIVRSMKQFAHTDASGHAHTDLNKAIEATLAISRHEYKLVADVELELGELPAVMCNAGEINQVLLNIVVNAAHAIASAVGTSEQRGKIRIRTERAGDKVVISIGDTGTGIPPAIHDRVFEPFFTTKEVGRGTGQGLAIARAVIEKHHGSLTFETEVGRGTTFHIRLPIDPGPPRNAATAAW